MHLIPETISYAGVPSFATRVSEIMFFTARACIPPCGASLETQRTQREYSFIPPRRERRQPGKNTSLRHNNWGFPAVRRVVFSESVSPDSEKERQLSVLSASAVKLQTLSGSYQAIHFTGVVDSLPPERLCCFTIDTVAAIG